METPANETRTASLPAHPGAATHAFFSVQEEAFQNLQRTANALMHPVSEMLRGVDLTPTQYNALRILRQVGEDGLPCREIGSRMITRDPDVTRLLDRLELRGLVIRSRDPRDRRVVRARATDEGVSLVNSLDDVMQRCHERQFGELDADELRSLNDMLERIRTMRGSDPA